MTVCKRLHVKSFNKSRPTLAKLSMEMEQTSVASVAIHHLAFSLAAKGIILNPTSMQQKNLTPPRVLFVDSILSLDSFIHI